MYVSALHTRRHIITTEGRNSKMGPAPRSAEDALSIASGLCQLRSWHKCVNEFIPNSRRRPRKIPKSFLPRRRSAQQMRSYGPRGPQPPPAEARNSHELNARLRRPRPEIVEK